MNQHTEQQLREIFTSEADRAPAPVDLASGALRKVRRRRYRIGFAYTLGAAALLAAGGLILPNLSDTNSVHPQAGGRIGSQAPAATTAPAASESCIVGYSPAEVAKLQFSFDGTVVAIVAAKSGDKVTFQVHHWFRGGSGDRVVITMPGPERAGISEDAWGSPATYSVGTRLLVSGSPLRGHKARSPLEDPVAWWGCGGFTRLYNPQDAATWMQAIR